MEPEGLPILFLGFLLIRVRSYAKALWGVRILLRVFGLGVSRPGFRKGIWGFRLG